MPATTLTPWYTLGALCCAIVWFLLLPPSTQERKCRTATAQDMGPLTVVPSPQEQSTGLLSEPTVKQAEGILQRHGVVVITNALSRKRTQALRAHARAKQEELALGPTLEHWKNTAYVISSENRNHTLFTVEEIQDVLSPLVKTLRGPLEAHLGPDPLLTELACISAGFGAKEQRWHPDSIMTSEVGRMVTAFIPLQDITPEMGPLEVCPGTHECTRDRPCGYASAGEEGEEHSPGIRLATGAGSAVIMRSSLLHRGSAHVLDIGPDRMVLTVSFASRPISKVPFGPTYAIRTDLWGRYSVHRGPWGTESMPQRMSDLRVLVSRKLQDEGILCQVLRTLFLCMGVAFALEPALAYMG